MVLFDQEGLAAVFGNGLSTTCVVNIGAQVTSLICIEVNETSVYFIIIIIIIQHILFGTTFGVFY